MPNDSVAVRFTADISELNAGLVNLSRQFTDFASATEASSSRSKSALDDYTEALKELGEGELVLVALKDRLASVGAGFLSTALAAGVTSSLVLVQIGLWAAAAIDAADKINAVARAMASMGNIGAVAAASTGAGFVYTTKTLGDFRDRLMEIPELTANEANSIQALFGTIQNYSVALNQALVDYVASAAKSKDEAKALATELAKVFTDPLNTGKQFLATLGTLTAEQQVAFDLAQRSGNVSAAQATIFDALITKLRAMRDEETRGARERIQNAQAWQGSSQAAKTFIDLQTESLAQQTAKIDEQIATLQKRADAVRAQPQADLEVIRRGTEAGSRQSAPELAQADVKKQIDDIEKAMDRLRSRMQQGIGTAETEQEIFRLGMQLAAAKQHFQQLDDQVQGGSAYERRNSEISRTALLSHQAAVGTLQEQINSDKQALDSEITTAAQRDQVKSNLAQHVFALEREKAAVVAAQASLAAGDAAKGSAEELAAKQRGTAAQKALYAEGSAERLNIERQEQSDRQAFDTVEEQIARDRETGKYNIALAGLQQREALTKEEAQTGRISHSDELAELTRINTEREALQTRYFTFMRDSYSDDRTQFSSYQRQIEEVAATSAARMQDVHRQVSKEINSDYKRTFEEIGSTGANAITGLITRQQTLGQAAQSVATSMLSMFVQSQARRVADYLAGVATEVTAHTAGEAAKTAATTGGVTARTSAETAGAATGAATMVANALKSIGASLGMTFAGVSANQAPLLGPAAPAEAAAVTAAVDTAAMSFLVAETGMWNVPSISPAILHPGEMVVPRAFADDLRANGGGLGGDSHTHLHFPGVMDTGAFLQAIKNNSSPIAKMISKAMTQNSSLRPAY